MTATNQEIVQRIKEVRQNRNMTQQDLATRLGKTAAAISDMERGKVQISASDLSIIADLLNTPIEFFYGEEIGDQYINDIVTLLRREEPEGRAKSLETVKMLLAMTQIADTMKIGTEKELSPEELGQFLTNFLSFTSQIKQMSAQLDDIKEKLVHELSSQGLDIPGLTP
jgi:transcriptional regulator with XRE-family HTH domain